MKMHKLTKILLLITVSALITALLFPLVTRYSGKFATDSGFDSDFDSGGWDSGSDWDSGSSWDSDYGSSGGSGGTMTFDEFLLFAYLFCLILCIGAQREAIKNNHGKLSGKEWLLVILFFILSFLPIINIIGIITGYKIALKNISSNQNLNYNKGANPEGTYIEAPAGNWNKALGEYGLSSTVVVQQAYAAYKKIQIAWMDGDVEPVRDVLSDEMYNMYRTQLLTLKAKHQKNMMEDITFRGGNVTNVIEQDDDVAVVINMHVTCRDYIIDTNNNEVVRGDKNHVWKYNYSLTFTFNKNDAKVITNCPGCNAELPVEGKSIKCEYCGTTINRESTNLVMTKKTMISQS